MRESCGLRGLRGGSCTPRGLWGLRGGGRSAAASCSDAGPKQPGNDIRSKSKEKMTQQGIIPNRDDIDVS